MEETRHKIESIMDDLLEQEIISDVEWISQEIPNSSLKELAVGMHATVGATSTVGTYDEYERWFGQWSSENFHR